MTEVTVPIEELRVLLYAASATSKIENLVAGAKQDPLFPKAAAIAGAFTNLDRIIKHAQRAETNYAGWNDPLTKDEIATLLTLCERDEGTWTVPAGDWNGKNLKPGVPNTLQGLSRRGMVEVGIPCTGVKWGNADQIPWVADPFNVVVRVTARGISASHLVNEEKGRS